MPWFPLGPIGNRDSPPTRMSPAGPVPVAISSSSSPIERVNDVSP